MITTHRAITFEADIVPRLQEIARAADKLMALVVQHKGWSDDVLTQDHFDADLIIASVNGEPISEELFERVKTLFDMYMAFKEAANADGEDGSPSMAKLSRAFL